MKELSASNDVYDVGVNRVRTCVGCRESAPKAGLTRIVAQAGLAVVDAEQRLPGRGAYLHPSRACLDRALRRRSLGRALRRIVETTEVAANPVWS